MQATIIIKNGTGEVIHESTFNPITHHEITFAKPIHEETAWKLHCKLTIIPTISVGDHGTEVAKATERGFRGDDEAQP